MPLSIFAPLGVTLPDWIPAPPTQPEWWELPPIPKSERPVPAPVSRPSTRKPAVAAGQSQLFDTSELQEADRPAQSDWIAAVLTSSVYVSQKKLAARVALPDDAMRQLLAALSERGGKLSRAALAQRLSVPEMRLGGMLSAVRRTLNVDQAPVLVVDEAAGTVELNIALLHQQFQVAVIGAHR